MYFLSLTSSCLLHNLFSQCTQYTFAASFDQGLHESQKTINSIALLGAWVRRGGGDETGRTDLDILEE